MFMYSVHLYRHISVEMQIKIWSFLSTLLTVLKMFYRKMQDFVLLSVGLVPHEPECLHMADGEVLVRRTYPCSGVDIKCDKNTDLSYGPWADRQRLICILIFFLHWFCCWNMFSLGRLFFFNVSSLIILLIYCSL